MISFGYNSVLLLIYCIKTGFRQTCLHRALHLENIELIRIILDSPSFDFIKCDALHPARVFYCFNVNIILFFIDNIQPFDLCISIYFLSAFRPQLLLEHGEQIIYYGLWGVCFGGQTIVEDLHTPKIIKIKN